MLQLLSLIPESSVHEEAQPGDRDFSAWVSLWKKNTIIMDVCIWLEFWLLNSYTLTSVCIFSILFSLNFSRCRQGEFVKQSRAFSVGKHFLYDCDLKVWLWGDTVRRNKILVTLRVKGLFTSVHCYTCHKTPWNCFQPVHWGQIQDNSPVGKN